jgi:hypothetical protein
MIAAILAALLALLAWLSYPTCGEQSCHVVTTDHRPAPTRGK